jgi:hypothetical protein
MPEQHIQDKLGPIEAARAASLRIKYRTEQGTDGLIGAILATLPEPHQKQRIIEQSRAKRKIVNAGRRAGKTTLAARVAIIKMCEAKRVLLASTTQDQADAFWEKCKVWLKPFLDSGELEKNEQRRIIRMPTTGGQIKVKTASDADTLRGDYADFLVLDECAMLAPDAWGKVAAPMLMDNDGDAWFLSTPRRQNWFYYLYLRAEKEMLEYGDAARWAKFHFTSYDNPHLSEEALAEVMEDLNEEDYQQEILAVFLEGEGAVFRKISENLTAPADADPLVHKDHFVVAGLDWGNKQDYTVLSVFCSTCKQELFMDRFNRMDWDFQHDRIVNSVNYWYVNLVLSEINSIGDQNTDALRKAGVPIAIFDTQKNTKGPLIRAMKLCLEQMAARWLNLEVSKLEFQAYEQKVSRYTGFISYSAPEKQHDDTVMAHALAWHAALNLSVLLGASATTYTEMAAAQEEAPDSNMHDLKGSMPGYVAYADVSYAGYNHAMQPPAGRPW